MKKTIFITLTLIITILVTVAFTTSDTPPYKNLQILPKDISKQKLDSIMHFYCQSLNVKCSFCHIKNEADGHWDFASDTVADKLITRKMMIMTNDINKLYFKSEEDEKGSSNIETPQEVTCFTCHRGTQMPLTMPVPLPPKVPIGQPPFYDNK